MSVFNLQVGDGPLLVSMPHIGTDIPQDLQGPYLPRALEVEDTDWHLDQLYDFLPALGATVLQARVSRYVIDLNRPPDDAPMYPGAANTELCPTHFFTGEPLYQPGCEPDAAEQQRRREACWVPYHAMLTQQLAAIRQQHGYALLWDAHSIRSEIPGLFEGRLPDLNIGTADGASCAPAIATAVAKAGAAMPGVSSVLNGRFKGGYLTRRYGQPAEQVHAVQLEMCQSTYMQEQPPFAYDAVRARTMQPVLRSMLVAAMTAAAICHAG